MAITFVTGNENKRREVAAILGLADLKTMKVEVPEIQSMNLEEVVRFKVRAAYQALGSPVFVEDVGVEIEAIGGFPGPFIKFWEEQVGYERALVLTEHEKNDRVHLYCTVGYKDATEEFIVVGKVSGRLVPRAGENGWGFDPYFMPDGGTQTYAEIGPEEKNKISHRVQAFTQLKAMLIEKKLI